MNKSTKNTALSFSPAELQANKKEGHKLLLGLTSEVRTDNSFTKAFQQGFTGRNLVCHSGTSLAFFFEEFTQKSEANRKANSERKAQAKEKGLRVEPVRFQEKAKFQTKFSRWVKSQESYKGKSGSVAGTILMIVSPKAESKSENDASSKVESESVSFKTSDMEKSLEKFSLDQIMSHLVSSYGIKAIELSCIKHSDKKFF